MPQIDIYTKDYCPYCHKAKALLDSLNVSYEDHDITSTPEVVATELAPLSGSSTVPQIFVDNRYIGGCDDIHALHEKGELLPILQGQ